MASSTSQRHPLPHPPPASSLSTLISSTTTDTQPTPQSSTTQILHNLQHQHLWTSLQTHPPIALPNSESISLISGLPPHRVYTHPDEQLFMLEKGLQEDDIPAERMFVLPLAQGQAWSLRRLVAVFDSLAEPDSGSGEGEGERERSVLEDAGKKREGLVEYFARRKIAQSTREWGGKRLLLGMVDKGMGGDGTVVYYVVQEGAVKPRQN